MAGIMAVQSVSKIVAEFELTEKQTHSTNDIDLKCLSSV